MRKHTSATAVHTQAVETWRYRAVERIRKKLRLESVLAYAIYSKIQDLHTKDDDKELIKLFRSILKPMHFSFKDIDLLPDMEKASSIILNALNKKEKVWIITDYDCDGVSCAAVATRFFRDILKKDVKVIVNERNYGNGISKELLDTIPELFTEKGVLITADHGSSDEERYKYLKSKNKNLKIIVTDHHVISEYPTSADAVLNNQRDGNELYKQFSGCAILSCLLYKLVVKYYSSNKDEYFISKKRSKTYNLLLAFMALSLVSDVMSMRDSVNRYIVRRGIPILYKLLGLDKKKTPIDLQFKLIPMINSANRTMNANLAYRFLTETDKDAIGNLLKDNAKESLFDDLIKVNNFRKVVTDRIANEIEINPEPIKVVRIVEQFAINGILASRIANEHRSPTFVLQEIPGVEDEYLHGSSRGDTHDVLEILAKVDEKGLLVKYGGHKSAAGFTVKKSDYKAFREFMLSLTLDSSEDTRIKEDVFLRHLDLMNLSMAIENMTPFGKDFEQPVFAIVGEFVKYTGNGSYWEIANRTNSVGTIFIFKVKVYNHRAREDRRTNVMNISLYFNGEDKVKYMDNLIEGLKYKIYFTKDDYGLKLKQIDF